MPYIPNLNEEKKLWKRGYRCVAGIDEVGRGPLAGPVVACALTARAKFKVQPASPSASDSPRFAVEAGRPSRDGRQGGSAKFKITVRDSKQLSAKKRELVYQMLVNSPLIEWGIGRVSEKVVDKINIFEATKLAMRKAVLALENKIGQTADFLLIDGNFGIDIAREQKSIIKGDEKIFSVAVASIIAKVQRDRIMTKYHKKYPQYGFDRHKGYGTKQHFEALLKYGFCPIHRKSFKPICESKSQNY